MQWALAISPVTALLSHCPNELKKKKKRVDSIFKLFSYTFTVRYLSFVLSVKFTLGGDHLDPKIHSTHQGIWRGINILVASRGLCWEECDIYGGISFFSILDLPRAIFFFSCFLQAVCLLEVFSSLDPSYSLMIVTTSLLQIHNSISQPQLPEKLFSLVL